MPALAEIAIRRWTDAADLPGIAAEIDAIFFESSSIRSFASEADRLAFRERWLGRYLSHYPEHAFVALLADGTAAGYLIGTLDDPARNPLFADIPYVAGFAALSDHFPAELHLNLAPAWRSKGVGTRLVDAFAAYARRARVPGMHVVTARGMRNVAFYERAGFREAGALEVAGRELLFLARPLAGD